MSTKENQREKQSKVGASCYCWNHLFCSRHYIACSHHFATFTTTLIPWQGMSRRSRTFNSGGSEETHIAEVQKKLTSVCSDRRRWSRNKICTEWLPGIHVRTSRLASTLPPLLARIRCSVCMWCGMCMCVFIVVSGHPRPVEPTRFSPSTTTT